MYAGEGNGEGTHMQEGGGVDQMFWRHVPASIPCAYMS